MLNHRECQNSTRCFCDNVKVAGVVLFLVTVSVGLFGGKVCSLPLESHRRVGKVTLLDHLNINHQGSRQDVLKAFYFECLGLTADPRKAENIENGSGTVWANGGSTQFHFSKGDTAQVLDGSVEMSYRSQRDLMKVLTKLQDPPSVLKEHGSRFSVTTNNDGTISCIDFHGTRYRLKVDPAAEDDRGIQPGAETALPCAAISCLEFNVPTSKSLKGISKFYEHTFGAYTEDINEECAKIAISPKQTLCFRRTRESVPHSSPHDDVRELEGEGVANYGAHISMYVHDFSSAYKKAEELQTLFVNHRFARRAYTLEDAIEQCMFRTLNIVDPDDPSTVILRLEHEVRSMTDPHGDMYKSFPLTAIPDNSEVRV